MLTPVGELQAATRTAGEQREYERTQVADHYEHRPNVFKLVLDSALTYPTGIFLSPHEDLETAQQRKFEYIRRLLDLRDGEKMLDVGGGWGSNLLYLTAHTQAEFHGITLSGQQRGELLARARERGLEDRLRVDICHLDELALPDESVDAVLFSGSIVHMHNRRGFTNWWPESCGRAAEW